MSRQQSIQKRNKVGIRLIISFLIMTVVTMMFGYYARSAAEENGKPVRRLNIPYWQSGEPEPPWELFWLGYIFKKGPRRTSIHTSWVEGQCHGGL